MERITKKHLRARLAIVNELHKTDMYLVHAAIYGGYLLETPRGYSLPSRRLSSREMYFYLEGLIDATDTIARLNGN